MDKANNEKKWSHSEIVNFYTNLLSKALKEIPETGAVMVLGPMFIMRSPEENFEIFERTFEELRSKGLVVFNHLPYVDHNLAKTGSPPFAYADKFEIFYKKLIQSGKIKGCYVLPGWEQSKGTLAEIEYCKESGVPCTEL